MGEPGPRTRRTLDADHLVVGAGAAGMAFTDALVDHSRARVALADRRTAPGGHWLDAYPYVRLHQASRFYGVASTPLGGGRLQTGGPEEGLHERADREEICAYYAQVLRDRLLQTGRVEFLGGAEYDAGRRILRHGGIEYTVPERCRIVDARYLSPQIPATTPPPFGVAGDARVLPAHALPRIEDLPSRYVVVGSGKTASDTVVWLLGRGVSPETICWVRPREPWMLDRAVVQPDPAVFLGMAADILEAAQGAASVDDLFLRLEDAGIMLRIDRSRTPTMARAPTLGRWELDLLRGVEDVVRRGHLRRVERGRLLLDDGEVRIRADALVVHCAARGLRREPGVPIWGRDAIRIQPVRAGFPCFGAALIGYVEATRDDDALKNRICLPTPYPSTPADWVGMTAQGTRSAMTFGAHPDIAAWARTVALNPARVPAGARSPVLEDVLARVAAQTAPGAAALTRLAREGAA